MNRKERFLFLLKVPPPLTGATIINKAVIDSKLISNEINRRVLPISYANDVSDLGKSYFRKFFKFISIIFKLTYELVFHRPLLVYFQISPIGLVFFRDLLLIFIIKIFKVKVLHHLHGVGINESIEKNKIFKPFYKLAFSKSSVICLSPLLAYDIKEIFSGFIYYVPNGIPDDFVNNNFHQTTNISNPLRILFLSNLLVSKGLFDFIEVMLILKNRKILFHSVIVGAEGDISGKELKKLILQKGLTNLVSYVGPKYNEEKNMYIRDCDVLFFPTKNDAFPLVTIEAMKYSKPIISSKIGAIPEIVEDGVNGCVLVQSDIEGFATKIEILNTNRNLMIDMGKRGREKFEKKYTLKEFEKKMLNVFKEELPCVE